MDWSIKKTAKKLGVSSRALRYYEVRGMLTPTKAGGIRYYDETQRDRIQQILRGKQLGFSLGEIQSLLDERPQRGGPDGNQACLEAQIQFLNQKKAEIEDALSQLAQLHALGVGSPLLTEPDADSDRTSKPREILPNLHRAMEFTGKRVAGLGKEATDRAA